MQHDTCLKTTMGWGRPAITPENHNKFIQMHVKSFPIKTLMQTPQNKDILHVYIDVQYICIHVHMYL